MLLCNWKRGRGMKPLYKLAGSPARRVYAPKCLHRVCVYVCVCVWMGVWVCKKGVCVCVCVHRLVCQCCLVHVCTRANGNQCTKFKPMQCSPAMVRALSFVRGVKFTNLQAWPTMCVLTHIAGAIESGYSKFSRPKGERCLHSCITSFGLNCKSCV